MGGNRKTSIIFGTYKSKIPSPMTGYTRTHGRGTAFSRQTLREGTRGGGGAIFFYYDNHTLPSQILPAAQAKHGKLPSIVRRPAMVHCLAYPKGIQRKDEIAVDIVTNVLEVMTTHLLP